MYTKLINKFYDECENMLSLNKYILIWCTFLILRKLNIYSQKKSYHQWISNMLTSVFSYNVFNKQYELV